MEFLLLDVNTNCYLSNQINDLEAVFNPNNKNIIIDTVLSLEFNAWRICHLDAVYTHTHADHLNGIDDLGLLQIKKKAFLYGDKEQLKK